MHVLLWVLLTAASALYGQHDPESVPGRFLVRAPPAGLVAAFLKVTLDGKQLAQCQPSAEALTEPDDDTQDSQKLMSILNLRDATLLQYVRSLALKTDDFPLTLNDYKVGLWENLRSAMENDRAHLIARKAGLDHDAQKFTDASAKLKSTVPWPPGYLSSLQKEWRELPSVEARLELLRDKLVGDRDSDDEIYPQLTILRRGPEPVEDEYSNGFETKFINYQFGVPLPRDVQLWQSKAKALKQVYSVSAQANDLETKRTAFNETVSSLPEAYTKQAEDSLLLIEIARWFPNIRPVVFMKGEEIAHVGFYELTEFDREKIAPILRLTWPKEGESRSPARELKLLERSVLEATGAKKASYLHSLRCKSTSFLNEDLEALRTKVKSVVDRMYPDTFSERIRDEELPHLLTHLETSRRFRAMDQLVYIGEKANAAVTTVRLALSDDSPAVRMRAAEFLAKRKDSADLVIPFLVGSLDAGNTDHDTITRLIGLYGKLATAHIPRLIASTHRTNSSLDAVIAIAKDDPRGAIPHFRNALQKPEDMHFAVKALKHGGLTALALLPELRNNLKYCERVSPFCDDLFIALGALRRPEAIPFLFNLYKNNTNDLRTLSALTEIGVAAPDQMIAYLKTRSHNRDESFAIARVRTNLYNQLTGQIFRLENRAHYDVNEDGLNSLYDRIGEKLRSVFPSYQTYQSSPQGDEPKKTDTLFYRALARAVLARDVNREKLETVLAYQRSQVPKDGHPLDVTPSHYRNRVEQYYAETPTRLMTLPTKQGGLGPQLGHNLTASGDMGNVRIIDIRPDAYRAIRDELELASDEAEALEAQVNPGRRILLLRSIQRTLADLVLSN